MQLKKIKNKICILFVGIQIIFLLNFSYAQTTSFIYYGVEQGLSQSQIQCITQGNDGDLWIGTLSGLTKYNGKTFKVYSKNDSLAEDWVTSLYKDQLGNIWIGHWAGGVSMFNNKNQKIENLFLEEYTQFKTVTSITQDKKNRYWIVTEGAGVFVYDPVSDKMGTITKKDGLSSDNVYCVTAGPNGNMWVATDIGISIFDVDNIAKRSILNIGNGLHSNRITTIKLVNENEMWIGSADAGVMVLKINTDFDIKNPYSAVASAGQKINQSSGLGSNFINCITEDNTHTIWIGTTGGGVSKCMPFASKNRSEALTKAVIYNYNTKQGLSYFNANTIFQDKESNVWIGTDIGLNQYRGERFQLYDEADGLINNLVWTTLCDKEGNIWLGTNQGISKISFSYSPLNKKQNHAIKNYTTKDGLGSNVVMSSFEDKVGNIWFGTGFGGVSKFNKSTNTFETFSKKNGLVGDVVFAISDDNAGNIWFGTKEGISRLNVKENTFRNYTIADGLGGNNVYRIFKDSKGFLWFGALGGSLSMFDGSSFKRFGEADGIHHRFILSINEDKQHNLWFGAYGGGLYKYDGKMFTNYTDEGGLTSNTPYSIISDNSNNIWIGSSRGIDKFDSKQLTFNHYGKAEGFLGVETNPNSVCMDKEGNLWYGTIMGAVKYNPREDKQNVVQPQTVITGLKLFMKNIPFPDDARFKYDQNHLSFSFLGISLTNPQKVKYKYKLEGFDKDWLPNYTTTNEAVYSNLPPGQYTFMVKACNNDGICNTAPVEYKFFIAPPFWQTAFFYIMMFIFFVFGLYVFDKMRTRKLKEATKKLEEKVQERTEELAVKNAELAQINKETIDSISYAKKIQDAVLLPETAIKHVLPQSFILNKPKDIVSGDFYWLEKKENTILFAVADCTGHGVPGAFMSIIGSNALNQVVVEKISSQPGKMLNNLNKILSETLKQHINHTKLKDGMDIALCSLNLQTLELQYAGAHNPLLVVRAKEFIEIKANNTTIGTYEPDNIETYQNHIVQLQKGDTIYIFSDGYVDQYGGPESKKFGLEQFRNMLSNINTIPLDEQKQILAASIDKWRGDTEQVDDILIMGVRV